jgi:hypothetical protein
MILIENKRKNIYNKYELETHKFLIKENPFNLLKRLYLKYRFVLN